MNSKTTSYLLAVLLGGTLIFAFFNYNRANKLESEKTEWQSKYEEALIDAEESGQRIERMKEELEKALALAEKHEKELQQALNELQKKKK